MRITFMILPRLQICPWAPKLQEILRGRDCLRSEEYRVMDETIKMTPLVKLKGGCCCLRCLVHMIDVRAMASGPCVILWVQHETFCMAGWLVSPVRWIWPDEWWKKTQGVVCKDWGQHLIVEWGGKGSSPFWVTPAKKMTIFSLYHPLLLDCVWKGHLQCQRQCCYRQKDPSESSRWCVPYF